MRATLLLLAFLGACAHLPDNSRRLPSRAFADTSDTARARFEVAAREAAGQPAAANGFVMLADGLDAFVARTTLARLAERSLDVQYYLYHDDLIGRLLTHALLEAADRGVRVRVLVDDMDFGGRDRGLALVNAHPNLEIRIHRRDVIISFGFLSMSIQAVLFACIFEGFFSRARARVAGRAAAFAILGALLSWNFTTLAVAAKNVMSSVPAFILVESAFTTIS